MTIREFVRKINEVIKKHPEIDQDTLITSAFVITPRDVGQPPEKRLYPPGTIALVCQNSGALDKWDELTIVPDKVSMLN